MVANEVFNPFPGLRAFEAEEDHLFFGREKQIDELLAKLRTSHFIAVTGASGSGKSSLVKCGLLPSLHRGYMAGAGSRWRVAVFRPGDDPLGNLARVLAQPGVIDDAPDPENAYEFIVEATLRRSNVGLIDAVVQSRRGHNDNVLIVVDQFEELFRFNQYEKHEQTERRDSDTFIDLLLQACRQTAVPIYIVITMRADFMGECATFHGLAEAINKSQYLVPRLSRDERREAITGPIAVGGGAITPRLLTQLLNDVGENPDQLPILQHALLRTWSYWQDHHADDEPLDLEHYHAIGMMAHALSQHAEEAYQELESARSKAICGSLFKILTERGDGRQGTRRPTRLGDICQITGASLEEVIHVIATFREKGRSFLMPPEGIVLSETSIIDISHESLMRIWDRLIRWVEEEAQSADIYKRLAAAAALYHEGRSGLWRDPELQFALNWYEEQTPNRYWAQRYDPSFERAIGFLKESKRQDAFTALQKERNSRLKIRRARVFAFILGGAAFVFLLLLIVVINLQTRAQVSAALAEKRAAEAREQKALAEAENEEAGRQRIAAEHERNRAEVQRLDADAQRTVAEQQRTLAYQYARNASRQEQLALQAKDEAEQQQREALMQKNKAEFLQEHAEQSEQKTNRLRLLALSSTLAFQSVREYRNNKELSTLLAVQAYRFAMNNGGDELNPDIYAALAQAAGNNAVYSGHEEAVRAVAISRDGKTMVSGGGDKTVRLWNLREPALPPQVFRRADNAIRCIAFSADATQLVVGDNGGNIICWRLDGTRRSMPVVVKPFNDIVNSLVIDHVSRRIIAGGNDGRILSLALDNLTAAPRVIDILPGKVTDLALSTGSSLLAAVCEHDFARVYALRGDATPTTVSTRYSQLLSVTFSHDGRFLAAGARSGRTYLWRLASPDSVAFILSGHPSGISDIAFSPDDGLLATAGLDRTVRLWNYQQPDREPVVLTGHTGWVWALTFNPEGNTLISAGEDKTIRSWTPSSRLLVKQACARLTRPFSIQEWNTYIGNNVTYEEPCK